MVAAALLAAALSAAQAGAAPWSDLEPAIGAADWIVLAEVRETHPISGLGIQVRIRVEEALSGNQRPGNTLAYLSDDSVVVKAGDRQLLFLDAPRKGGWHAILRQRVGGADPNLEAKVAWLRTVLGMRRLAAERRGPAFVRFYQDELAAGREWERERALAELERLVRVRPEELHALAAAKAVRAAATAERPESFRTRLESLAVWLERPLGR